MLQPKKIVSLIWASLISLAYCIPTRLQNCECGLFLKDDTWLPKNIVLSLANEVQIDCTNPSDANKKCRQYCSDEIVALNILFLRDPNIFREYPPSQGLPCDLLPRETVSFSKVCDNPHYILSSRDTGPSVCCDTITGKPNWCGLSTPDSLLSLNENKIEGRKLDLTLNENDNSQNEIEVTASFKPEKPKKPFKTTVNKTPTQTSWLKAGLQYFGYNSVGQMVKNIDLFSLPSKFQHAYKVYRDEVSMGRCYMEFTTFKVFAKQGNPFEDIIRKKRAVEEVYVDTEPITRFDEFESQTARSQNKDHRNSHNDVIKRIFNGISGFLERSESTRQYSHVINSLLPLVSQMMAGSGTSHHSPLSMIMNYAGPLLAQMTHSRPLSTNSIDDVYSNDYKEPPIRTPPTNQAPSGLTSVFMTLLGNAVNNFFRMPLADEKTENVSYQTVITTTTTPRPMTTTRPQVFNSAGIAGSSTDLISSIFNTFIQMFTKKTRPPQTASLIRPEPEPSPAVRPQQVPSGEKKEGNRFIDVLLEIIRPIFISIVGNAPGESGVEAIRRVSTLSTLGRVDDTLRDEVDSPLFCFKKYMVNKAWSLTETGIRSVISKFTPEEQARMLGRITA